MNNKIYIIVKKFWRYNDEYYTNYNDVFEDVVQKYYTTKEQADLVCEQQNEQQSLKYYEDDRFCDNSGEDLTKEDVEFYEVLELN